MEENRMYGMYEDDEIEIDILDLVVRLLRHWRSLIAVIIIGLALGGGFGYMKASKNVKNSNPSNFSEYKVSADVEKNMELARLYRNLYESQLKYNENAILMKMDPNHLYQGNLRYYMKGGEDTKRIAESFRMLLNREDVREKLNDASGDIGIEYLMEVIACSIDLNVGYQGSVFNPGSDMYDLVVNYSINFPDEESLIPVMTALKEAVLNNIDDMSDKYEAFTWEIVDDSMREAVVPDYINRQKGSVDALNTYLSNFTKIEGNFKGDDADYYKAVYINGDESAIGTGAAPVDNDSSAVMLDKKTVIKWAVIVTFLCCCAWGGIIVMSYLLDGKLKTVDDLKVRYGLKVLGFIDSESKNSGVDSLIDRLAKACKPIANDNEYVAKMKKNLMVDHILEVGEDTEDGFIHNDEKTLEKAKAADGVIINTRLNKTTYKQLDREIDVCKIQGIKVFGVVCRG